MSPLFGVPLSDFNGLDLRSDSDATSGALDMLNVELDAPGRMRSRDGFTKLSTAAAASPFRSLTAIPNSSVPLVIATYAPAGFDPQNVTAINASTGAAITTIATTGVIYNTVPFGIPGSTTLAYAACGASAGTILRYNSSSTTFQSVSHGLGASGLAAAKIVNVTPVDNRLMLINITGITNTDGPSTIAWSGAGAPETYGVNDFLQLSPADGEQLISACNFNNQTFVFKQSKFFVFTGNTTDPAGNPIFNYRTVNAGIGVHPIGALGGSVAGPDGVYFIGRDGIYKTTGGAPIKISTPVDPIFGVGPASSYFQGQTVSYATASRAYLQIFKNRLYFTYDGATARGMLIYDLITGQWLYNSTSANGLCTNPSTGLLTFAYAGLAAPTATNDLGSFSSAATTDAGTAITSRYRSAFFTFDYHGRTPTRSITGVEKIVRETIFNGSGTLAYTLSNQWVLPANLPAPRTITLGAAPQVTQSRDRTAVKGRAVSFQVSGTSPWNLEELIMNIYGYGPTGLKET